MDAETTRTPPFGVVFEDQPLGRFDHIAWQRQPIEMGEHQPAAGGQQAVCLAGGGRPVEPVPALASGDDLEARWRQSGVFGAGDHSAHRDAGLSIEPIGLGEHGFGRIEAGHLEATASEAARQAARAGAEIQEAFTRSGNAIAYQPVEQRVWKTGAMAGVVLGGAAEIDHDPIRRQSRTLPAGSR